jgi:beta-phosphoglucomutase
MAKNNAERNDEQILCEPGMALIKAIIFDLDGVIVDTAHYHYLAWKRLAKELGGDLSPEDNEKLKGVSRMDSLEIILQLNGITLPDGDKAALAARKNAWFIQYIEALTPEAIFPGVKEIIQQLKADNFKVGLASSSKNAAQVLGVLGILNLFDAVVDGTMVTHSKPDPEVFLLAAEKLEVTPVECVVFEDAEAGVEAALRAGMKCIGVGSAAQLRQANLVIPKTGDFQVEMLKTLYSGN